MIFEYPDYYEKFHCIGGKCKDSCCAGWEVDIDDDSARMYQNVPLPIGEKLREKLKLVDGGYRFQLCRDKRCPFLNKDNLCDIIIALGEGGLSVTCTEYPRYTCETPDYHETDLTLSCPEAARIFFSTEEPIRYERRAEEFHDTDWEEDPFEDDSFEDDSFEEEGPEEDDFWDDIEDDEEEDAFEKEEDSDSEEEVDPEVARANREKLERILDLRDAAMEMIQNRKIPLEERILNMEELFPEEEQISDQELLSYLDQMEVVNPDWLRRKADIEAHLDQIQEEVLADRVEGGLHFQNQMERFLTYLLFRYTIDIYYKDNPRRVLRFTRRAKRVLELLIAQWCYEHETHVIPVGDLEDCARIFSRQVEHSEENVDLLLEVPSFHL